jgi:tetratricopeptide (TPR) repeat protein
MYYLASRYKDAVSELSKVTRAAPDVLAGHLFLGMSYVKLAQPQQAIGPLKEAMRLDPSNREAACALLTCYLALDRYQQARHQLEFFARETTNEESLYVVGQAYLEMGRALTSRMAQQYRSSAWAHRLVGDLASDRSDWNAAIDAYQKALTTDPEMPGIHSALAAAMRASGKSDQATAPVHDKTGSSRTALCANLSAQACAAQLQQKPNRTAKEELALGRAFEATTEPEKAADEFASALAKSGSAEALYVLIRAYTALGDAYFGKLTSSFPDSARAHELRAEVYRLREDFPAALQEFDLAVQKLPDDGGLHQSLGEIDLLLERLDEAKRQLQKSARLSPGDAQTEYLLAQVLVKQKDTGGAVIHLKEATVRDPNLLEAHALLGTAYMHMNQPALARPELQKAIAIDYYGDLHFQLFKAYRALGDSAAAEKALARSKELRKKSLASAVAKLAGHTAASEIDPENQPSQSAQSQAKR